MELNINIVYRSIQNAHDVAKNFKMTKRAINGSAKDVNKIITENLKQFYSVGIEFVQTAQRIKRVARYRASINQYGDTFKEMVNYPELQGPINHSYVSLRNTFKNLLMKYRIKRACYMDSELYELKSHFNAKLHGEEI